MCVCCKSNYSDQDDDDAKDYDDDDDDDGYYYDLYIIGAVCNENAYFPYSRDLVVSHVYRHLSLFKSVWKPKKRPNPLKKSFFFKGFGFFSCL